MSEVKCPPIPGYELLRFLAWNCGAWGGSIHLARRKEDDTRVVLRVFDGRPADPWVETTTAQRRLRHPNILEIIDFGESDGRWYQAIEHVVVQTLAGRLRSGPLAAVQAMSLSRGLALALQHARDHGLIYGRFSSSSIFLTEHGVAKLCALDFKAPSDIGWTEVLGNFAFLPPEYFGGGDLELTPSMDVYRVGVAMYTMLTGHAPFVGDSKLVVAQQVLRDLPAPPRQISPAIPASVEVLCMKCLAKSPQDRYATPKHLAEAISSFVTLDP